MSKVAFCTLYSIKAKVEQIETYCYTDLASFIGIINLIGKIGITNLLSLEKTSFEEINWYNKITLRKLQYIIIFVFCQK